MLPGLVEFLRNILLNLFCIVEVGCSHELAQCLALAGGGGMGRVKWGTELIGDVYYSTSSEPMPGNVRSTLASEASLKALALIVRRISACLSVS